MTDLSTLGNWDGYWVAATGPPCTLTMTGEPVVNITRTSTAGWNMVGSTATEIPFEGHLTSEPEGIIRGSIYTYDPPATRAYTIPVANMPGCGYWISAATDGDIVLE
ncbi:hypothetical protein [Methanogenium cariaci]|uniref:hypothetical protein n=1 Tax=Methanogenium cariaci TaxID=2197 RepID=UPI0007832F04|nr:hypothetical protein [Methanogenium cariaci]